MYSAQSHAVFGVQDFRYRLSQCISILVCTAQLVAIRSCFGSAEHLTRHCSGMLLPHDLPLCSIVVVPHAGVY